MYSMQIQKTYLDLRTQRLLTILVADQWRVIWRYYGSQMQEIENPQAFQAHTVFYQPAINLEQRAPD